MSTVPILVTFVVAMSAFALWVYVLVRDSASREVRGPQPIVVRAVQPTPEPAEPLRLVSWVAPTPVPVPTTPVRNAPVWTTPVRTAPARTTSSDRGLSQRLAVGAIAGLLFLSVYLGATRGSIRHPA